MYFAQINFKIDIFPMNGDGTLNTSEQLTESDLKNLGITSTAVLGVSGVDKEDCVKKLLECLNKINYE